MDMILIFKKLLLKILIIKVLICYNFFKIKLKFMLKNVAGGSYDGIILKLKKNLIKFIRIKSHLNI